MPKKSFPHQSIRYKRVCESRAMVIRDCHICVHFVVSSGSAWAAFSSCFRCWWATFRFKHVVNSDNLYHVNGIVLIGDEYVNNVSLHTHTLCVLEAWVNHWMWLVSAHPFYCKLLQFLFHAWVPMLTTSPAFLLFPLKTFGPDKTVFGIITGWFRLTPNAL